MPEDPVLVAIADHQSAWREYCAEIERVQAIRPRWRQEAERRAACDLYDVHTTSLIGTRIETPAGLMAFVDYVASLPAYGIPAPAFAIEAWHMSDAMEAIASALKRFGHSRSPFDQPKRTAVAGNEAAPERAATLSEAFTQNPRS